MATYCVGMRRRVYEVLTNPARGDRVGRMINFSLLLLIAANVAASVIETDAQIRQSAPVFFRWFETISVGVFTVEYLLRLWSCTANPIFANTIGGRLRYAVRPMALIDLAAIAPFYAELLLPGTLDLRFLRILRVLRVFRLLRVGPLNDAFARLIRVIQAKRVELGVSMALVAVAMLLAAGAMYSIEHSLPNTQFTSIPRAMWWSIVTVTTIGYGDMTPQSPLGQFVAGIVAFVGICSIALPVGIISSGYLDELNRSKNVAPSPTCRHCGGEAP
jgi:voltage-gated potassium channel